MTIQGTDLIAILALVAIGCVTCYFLLIRKMQAILSDRQLRIADQLASLDDAIRALETRLTEHRVSTSDLSRIAASAESPNAGFPENADADGSDETREIAPEIQAVIAAATVATLGQNAVVQSVKAMPSAWTQQGRVMVQGGHNLRVRQ